MARILVIDDDAHIRALLEEMLGSLGHEVVSAADGNAGLALHRANPVILVLTDIFMPEKEGLGTILDVLTAESALANARAQEVQARADWLLSLAQLAHGMGSLTPETAGAASPSATGAFR